MVVDGNTVIAASAACGPMYSTDGGFSWAPHRAGALLDATTQEPLAMYAVGLWNNQLWASFGNQGVYVFGDSAWKHVAGIPQPAIVRVLERDTATGVIYAGTQAAGLYAFDAATDSFVRLPDVSPDTALTIAAFASTRRGFLAATSLHGLQIVHGKGSVYQSDNRGFPFEPISTNAIVESASGWQVSNTLPFAVAGGMYVRGPGSDVWKLFNDGIDDYLTFAFDIVASNQRFILSAGYKAALGLFTWQPPELTWTPWNEGLDDLEVSALAVVAGGEGPSHIVAGTRSGHIFIRPVPTINTSVANPYPTNTHRGHCVTRQDLQRMAGDVQLFDLQGRHVDAFFVGSGVAIVIANGKRQMVFVTD
jgi:hypothetical protein